MGSISTPPTAAPVFARVRLCRNTVPMTARGLPIKAVFGMLHTLLSLWGWRQFLDNGFIVGYFAAAGSIWCFFDRILCILLVPGGTIHGLYRRVGALSRSCILVGMVQGKIPVSGASGFGTGDPSATDFYIIIGRTAARIDAHIGSKGFLCVCSLDGTYLTVISLCNVADDLIGKVSAFVQG